MTIDNPTRRRVGYVTFHEAPATERNVAAVLITRDELGTYRAYERDFAGPGLDPELVASLVASAEIRNLTEPNERES